METMYCFLTAVTTCWISACSTPCNYWKTRKFLSYTILSLYKVTHVALLGICIIQGSQDICTRLVTVWRTSCWSPKVLDVRECLLLGCSGKKWCLSSVWVTFGIGHRRWEFQGFWWGPVTGRKFLGCLPWRYSCWNGKTFLSNIANRWRKLIKHSLEIND